MERFREAILGGVTGEEFAGIPVPDAYRAAHVRKDEAEMFAGLPSGQDAAEVTPRR